MTDREKLLEIRKSVSCKKGGCRFCDYSKYEHCMEELLVDHLLAHGVVVREKGEWLPCGFGKEIMCSACGCELDDVWEYRYCPNCGADMTGGERNV